MGECPFCEIVAGRAFAHVVQRRGLTVAITPLNPVVPGHVIVFPTVHVADALERPSATAMTMHHAAQIAKAPCNLITSVGPEATQTVMHLHIHIVPRRSGDGLSLPWSSGACCDHVK